MGSSSLAAEHSNGEVLNWLKTLPVAPEYHPTPQEFLDPISYIFKIEKEASNFGICKIVPPLPPQPKKTVISHFNNSISLLNNNDNVNGVGPTFTTRKQQVGFCPRKQRPIQKSVWQSGENYTLQEFEAKAKNFEKSYLKGRGKKGISPLEVETLYWKANGDRPFSVEYANDMPGSAFVPLKSGEGSANSSSNVGESAWNMRAVARAKGSLLRYMKEEIPGVTSPMVYIAMLFSWFAWHVEDHDLHSLNYLHFGAPKTWYGVPRDAASAFEEVIRVHGFGEEINPLVTFATLGEKTTVMSPEVLMNAGVPCCRLVQNAGDFVVTFPRAYHSGFSHGFNCGEASNIATPEWLRFAKDAAIRRASINYPPMVSHFQLLYDLALATCLRMPMGSNSEPRSSRLKDKKKGEGEILVKQMFVEDMMQHNELLYSLGQGSEVVLLPHNSSEKFAWSNLRVCSKYKMKPGLPFSFYSSEESIKDDIMLARDVKQHKAFYSVKAKFNSMNSETQDSGIEKRGDAVRDGLSDRGLFSCVKCGIWTFACVAIVQPTDSAAQYLMSADCSVFNNCIAGSGVSNHGADVTDGVANLIDPNTFSASMEKIPQNGLYSADRQAQSTDHGLKLKSNIAEILKVASPDEANIKSSALGLLALTYGNSSDSDEDDALLNRPDISEDTISGDGSCGATFRQDAAASPIPEQDYDSGVEKGTAHVSSRSEHFNEVSLWRFECNEHSGPKRVTNGNSEDETHGCSANFTEDDTMTSEHNYSPIAEEKDAVDFSRGFELVVKSTFPSSHGCNEDSSRLHVFCLEHAAEVEKQLRPIGGVHILLLCHPDYPNVQTEAMKVAEELDMEYVWKDIAFSEATKEDEERMQSALISEEVTPKNGDWAVKLGINLFYSAILSRSPLYSKQMPYNSVIYDAFGCSSPSKYSPAYKIRGKGCGRQRKLVVAGKWCGKVWMSNQVHPLLLQRDVFEGERAPQFCLPSEDKIWRRSETSKAQTISTNRKLRRKRKLTAKGRVAKKMKLEAMELADTDLEESEGDMPVSVPLRSNKKSKTRGGPIKRVKHQEEEFPDTDLEESEGDMPVSVPRRSNKKSKTRGVPTKRVKHREEFPDTDLEGSEGDMPVSVPRRSIKKSKTRCGPVKRVKHQEEFPDSASEESSDNEPHQGPWRSARALKPGGKRAHKLKGQQNAASNESSDESIDDRSNHLILRSRNSKMRAEGKPTRQVKGRLKETVDSESEGSLSDESVQEHRTFSRPQLESNASQKRVSKQFELVSEDEMDGGPSTRLRKRISKPTARVLETKLAVKRQVQSTKGKKAPVAKSPPARKGPKMRLPAMRAPAMKGLARKAPAVSSGTNLEDEEPEFRCDLEGCTMSFESSQDLALHKRNVCPVKGCGKKFFSHKYLVQHRRVHMDDRPLKCPWKGCKMTFKWAWARTEHIRVHTGARPYVCTEPGCGQTFRFVSDFSRHKRKTGHSPKKVRK